MRSISTTTSTKPLPPPSSSLLLSPPSIPTPHQQQSSMWHSPVPYLLGGLAAMLGLIAFALMILACSYWKLSGRLQGENGDQEGDLESGDSAEKAVKVSEEKILVIMAGDEKPTFLATPVSSRTTSFCENNDEESEESKEEKTESSSEKVVKEEETGTNHQQRDTSRDPTQQLQQQNQ